MDAVKKIRKWMDENDCDGVVLKRRDNYAWVGEGAENHVMSNTGEGVACYIIERDKIRLLADSSDLARMEQEQNPLKAEGILTPWYEPMADTIRRMAEGKRYVSDTGIAGTLNVQDQLRNLRMQLSDRELERYRALGSACAKLVEGVCREAEPGQTEAETAQKLRCRCIEQGISPDCVLVGADERILKYRHPMPTGSKIRKSLMVVLGAQKHGLYISMTRMVFFEPAPEEIRRRYEKTSYIFACMQKMMKEGLSYKTYFEEVKRLYDSAGYAEEWKLHHQGGPTGYDCREYVVTPEMAGELHCGQAYAWNPTIRGTKCEETTFLGTGGVETFTQTPDWPRAEIRTPYGTYSAADILEK